MKWCFQLIKEAQVKPEFKIELVVTLRSIFNESMCEFLNHINIYQSCVYVKGLNILNFLVTIYLEEKIYWFLYVYVYRRYERICILFLI